MMDLANNILIFANNMDQTDLNQQLLLLISTLPEVIYPNSKVSNQNTINKFQQVKAK